VLADASRAGGEALFAQVTSEVVDRGSRRSVGLRSWHASRIASPADNSKKRRRRDPRRVYLRAVSARV
jgi:hypothetical protein